MQSIPNVQLVEVKFVHFRMKESIPYVQLVEVKYKIVADANLVSGSGGTRKDIEDWLGRLPLALSGPPLYTICRGATTTSTSVWWT